MKKKTILFESQEEWYWTNGSMEDYMDQYNLYWILNEIYNTREKSIWFPLIDSNSYKQALEDFVKNGELLRFPSKKIYDWADIIMRNGAIFNNIAGLYGEDPNGYIPFREVYDQFVDEYDEETAQEFIDNLEANGTTVNVKWYPKPIEVNDEFSAMVYILQENGVYDFLRMPDGSFDAWSDQQGFYDVGSFDDCSTVEEALVLINKIMDIYHQRSDLASLFITGGRESLRKISMETDWLYKKEQLNESVEYAEMLDDGNLFLIYKNPTYDEFWGLMNDSHEHVLRALVSVDSKEHLCFVWDAYYKGQHNDILEKYLRTYNQNMNQYAQVYCDKNGFRVFGLLPDWFEETYYSKITLSEKEESSLNDFFDNMTDEDKELLGLDESLNEDIAYAASKSDYEKPSLKAIGSGEGHAAHGWGLYYSANKDVAEDYLAFFSNTVVEYKGKIYDSPVTRYCNELNDIEKLMIGYAVEDKTYKNTLYELNNIASTATQAIKEKCEKAIELFKKSYKNGTLKFINKNKGALHTVELPTPEDMVDEALSVEKQNEKVKEKLLVALEPYKKNLQKLFNKNHKDLPVERDVYTISFKHLYDLFTELLYKVKTGKPYTPATTKEKYENDKKILNLCARYVSMYLLKNGIKGITYDGGRDGKCFVIFNPNDVKVIEKEVLE